ncbi:MAG: bifunctional metallophosphatase/5'-nucleotidase, partial [Actinomycetales bacterium]
MREVHRKVACSQACVCAALIDSSRDIHLEKEACAVRIAWGRLSAAVTSVLVGSVLTAVPASAADPVTIQLFDINDFHGRIDANTVKFAGTLEQLRAQAGEGKSLFLSAGDNIGASLFASATQKDEPTIDVLNALDLDVSAVGNHELDKGAADLTGRVSDRADFPYVAANVIDKTTGKPLLPAFETFTVNGLKVAVVGALTEETPSLVSPAGISGLEFTDPVEAVNKTVAELNAATDKPDVIVADYHEGAGAGTPDGATIQQEIAAGGTFADIATKTDASVDAIFTGHTHKQYAWDGPIPGSTKTRPILQTGSYGENIGNIGLTVDPDTDEVTAYTVKNVPRTTTADATLVSTYPRVAAVKPIVDAALENAKKVGETPVGEVTDDITTAYSGTNRDDRSNESTLGNLVSDAVLAQVKNTTAGADLAVTNPGGLRNELFFTKDPAVASDKDGSVNYAEANAVLPFVNNLSSVTLTGASLKKVFEQQWQTNPDGTVPSRPFLALGSSSNVRWTYDDTKAAGSRITSLWVNDEPVSPTASYKVAVPSFLVSGGDNFRAFTEGKGVDTGLVDYEAWIDYLQKNQPLSPSYARHAVKATGVKSEYRVGSDLSVGLAKLDLTSLGSPANKSVSAKITKDGATLKNLGSSTVTDGAATISGALPAGVTGDLVLEATAYPSGTRTTIPLTVKGARITATADDAVFGEDTTVHVTATAPGAAPTGAVKVLDGSTELGTGTLVDGKADVTIDTEKIGAGTSELTV